MKKKKVSVAKKKIVKKPVKKKILKKISAFKKSKTVKKKVIAKKQSTPRSKTKEVTIKKRVALKRVLKKTPLKKVKVALKVRKLTIKKTKLKNKLNKVTRKVKKIKKKIQPTKLVRARKNPIMSPSFYPWESQAVLNPAAVYLGGRVHLFYRAMGSDGVSRIGYASSTDGINFTDRLFYPIFFSENVEEMKNHWPYTSPARPEYNQSFYASGGGWGGCEDPRAVVIDGVIYMTFNMFNGWHNMRVAVVAIREKDLLAKNWNWMNLAYLSRPGDRQKNWVLFPEKINGKFVVFHNIDVGDPDRVGITYAENLDWSEMPYGDGAPDPQQIPDHDIAWHNRTRSASAPPIKTKEGWLVFYHAMSPGEHHKYKLGAVLLDMKDPSKVIARAMHPLLEPDEWYENDWKPGIIYASGAVKIHENIFVYYGGGDKTINVATLPLSELLHSMKTGGSVKLKKKKLK